MCRQRGCTASRESLELQENLNLGLGELHSELLATMDVCEMTVAWKGGFLGGEYSTTVAWEIAERSHVSAKVMSDSAVVAVEAKNEQLLDDYFRDKVYPAFVADTGGG